MTKTPNKNGSKVLKSEQVNLGKKSVSINCASASCQPAGGGASGGPTQPEVIPNRSADGKISTITVRCSCGREIHINCDYLEEESADENA